MGLDGVLWRISDVQQCQAIAVKPISADVSPKPGYEDAFAPSWEVPLLSQDIVQPGTRHKAAIFSAG